MYSVDDFAELDKSNFRCFKFPDGSIYYGEITYVNKEGKEVNNLKDYTEDIMKKELRLVRHGNGVQLFGVTDIKCTCNYEGRWQLDKKKGKGLAHFPDGSTYEGEFDNDVFEGAGKFVWKAGHVYVGMWQGGRMEGMGEFKHQDGHVMKGTFKNNYIFDKERSVFVNPFLSVEDAHQFKAKNAEYISKVKIQKEKFSRANILRVTNQQELIISIEETIKNDKTPLIIRSTEDRLEKSEIFKFFPKDYREIDFRFSFLKLRETTLGNVEAFEDIKKLVVEAMTKGYYLILNFDDCQVKYEELYDPDLKEFYGKMMLSPFLWTPNRFSQPRFWQPHLCNLVELKLDKNFKFVVYSKFLIDSNLPEHDLINEIEKRFEKCFPLVNINVLIFCSPGKK